MRFYSSFGRQTAKPGGTARRESFERVCALQRTIEDVVPASGERGAEIKKTRLGRWGEARAGRVERFGMQGDPLSIAPVEKRSQAAETAAQARVCPECIGIVLTVEHLWNWIEQDCATCT